MNYAAFRAEYVKLARMTSYERANYRAEQAKQTHAARLAALVEADVRRVVPGADRPTRWERYPIGRIYRATRRDWWAFTTLWWTGREASVVKRPTEARALVNVQESATAAESIRAVCRVDVKTSEWGY